MSTRILFLISGLGLGNSTRCHAVIQRLQSARAEVAVATSGNGLWYFDGRPEVLSLYEAQSLYYGQSGSQISIFHTLLNAGEYVNIMRHNKKQLSKILDDFKPNVAVTDSVYTLAPMRDRKIPVAALNNADVVHEAYRFFDDTPKSIRAQFYGIEELDYLFHRKRLDLVLSPTLDRAIPVSPPPYARIGPIVRTGYGAAQMTRSPKKVVIMLSGSVFGTPVRLTEADRPVNIEVVGRRAPENWPEDGQIIYHGRQRETGPILKDADLVIINGGFSAVSEIFCMRKPMLVVPVPNHAEQWLNARMIKHLGVGDIIAEEDLEAAILPALSRIEEFRASYEYLPAPEDGAQQAAKRILALAELPG